MISSSQQSDVFSRGKYFCAYGLYYFRIKFWSLPIVQFVSSKSDYVHTFSNITA